MSTAPNQVERKFDMEIDRQKWIGGSDVSSIVGMGKYSCALRVFNDKTGVEKTNRFFGSNATARGIELEEFSAHKYAQITGRQVRKSPPKHHRLHWRLRPQSDYEVINTEGLTVHFPGREPFVADDKLGPFVLSIKVPGMNIFRQIQYEGLSEEYIFQLQYEMACWNRKAGVLAAFNAEQWKMIYFDVPYDPELGEAAVQAAARFIIEHIDAGVPPEKLKDPTSAACRRCEYLVGCQHDSLLACGTEDKEGIEFPFIDNPIAAAKLLQIQELRAVKRETEDAIDQAIAEVAPIIGDKSVAEFQHPQDESLKLRMYFREQKGRESFQWAKARDYFKKDEELMAKLTKFVSQSKPSRPLRLYEVPVR